MRALARPAVVASAAALAIMITAGCTSSSQDSATSAAPRPSGSSPMTPTASPTTRAPSLATTAVPAPRRGNIKQTLAPGRVTTAAPVSLSEKASFGAGLSARITKVQALITKGRGPGETSGKGVAVSITVTNDSDGSADLSRFAVSLVDARNNPGIPITGAPTRVIAKRAAANDTASGVYVFTLPSRTTNPVTISVSYTTSAPTVRFVGTVK